MPINRNLSACHPGSHLRDTGIHQSRVFGLKTQQKMDPGAAQEQAGMTSPSGDII